MKQLILVVLATGCLGPLASDTPPGGAGILPAGSVTPSWTDDPTTLAQIVANQGVSGTIRRESAFANGAPVHVWDFGPAPTFAAPLFMIVTHDDTGAIVRVPHNTIIEALPGDPGYSPYWAVLYVQITPAYAGEILPSAAAVDAAVAAGLVEPPVLQSLVVNCPIVAPDVRLAVGGGASPIPPNAMFYFAGETVPYFDFGPMPAGADGTLVEQRRYELHREGEEPLSEPVRNVDIDGDGDTDDTNDLYEAAPGLPTSSPVVRTVEVAIPSTIASIDTSQNDAVAALDDATQLFDPDPTADVLAFQIGDTLHNRPGQQHEGAL
ncbi:MAG TPA: hypothetical protein VGM88_05045 [Kofleriaceae bacterium]